MSAAYQINDEQAAVFLAALILENGKNGNKPLRVSYDSVLKATEASGINARDLFLDDKSHQVEFKLLK